MKIILILITAAYMSLCRTNYSFCEESMSTGTEVSQSIENDKKLVKELFEANNRMLLGIGQMLDSAFTGQSSPGTSLNMPLNPAAMESVLKRYEIRGKTIKKESINE